MSPTYLVFLRENYGLAESTMHCHVIVKTANPYNGPSLPFVLD